MIETIFEFLNTEIMKCNLLDLLNFNYEGLVDIPLNKQIVNLIFSILFYLLCIDKLDTKSQFFKTYSELEKEEL